MREPAGRLAVSVALLPSSTSPPRHVLLLLPLLPIPLALPPPAARAQSSFLSTPEEASIYQKPAVPKNGWFTTELTAARMSLKKNRATYLLIDEFVLLTLNFFFVE